MIAWSPEGKTLVLADKAENLLNNEQMRKAYLGR